MTYGDAIRAGLWSVAAMWMVAGCAARPVTRATAPESDAVIHDARQTDAQAARFDDVATGPVTSVAVTPDGTDASSASSAADVTPQIEEVRTEVKALRADLAAFQAEVRAAMAAAARPAAAPALVTAAAPAVPHPADVALTALLAGNGRFVGGVMTHPHQSADRRSEMAKGQKPFAIVLGCSDSRTSPTTVFDAGLGDLFEVRLAGNVFDDAALGSIEYAAAHLDVPLVVVLGHERCGAVKATCDAVLPPTAPAGHTGVDFADRARTASAHADPHVATDATVPAATAVAPDHHAAQADAHAAKPDAPADHVGALVELLRPAVLSIKDKEGDAVDNAVSANATRVARLLRNSRPVLGKLVKAGKVKVVAARYDLDTGEVTILDGALPTQTADASR